MYQHHNNIHHIEGSVQVLRALANQLREKYPHHSARIGRAVALIEHGHILRTPTCYHVRSQSGDVVYTISRHHDCPCPDATRRSDMGDTSPCKHAWAVALHRNLTWAMERAQYTAYVKDGAYIEGYAWPSKDYTYAWFIGKHEEVPVECKPWDIVVHGKVIIRETANA